MSGTMSIPILMRRMPATLPICCLMRNQIELNMRVIDLLLLIYMDMEVDDVLPKEEKKPSFYIVDSSTANELMYSQPATTTLTVVLPLYPTSVAKN
nr:hypothetical protein [Tanacetum cinerariifolium]